MAPRCDMIIRDATVFDGSGAPRFKADVAVTGDRHYGGWRAWHPLRPRER